ncbi:MAG: hypothetical protein II639_04545, partial [Clostridia bacterium]|nr:hypothetical protein [Clostridia bacterium]
LSLNPPLKRGMFSEMGSWYDDESGYIEMWEEPIPGHVYCIGCDTAGDGSDFFVSYVGDQATNKCVCKYRAKTDEKLFCEQMFHLGLFYNYAMIAPDAALLPIEQQKTSGSLLRSFFVVFSFAGMVPVRQNRSL